MPIHEDTILTLLQQPCICLSDTKQGWTNKTWEILHNDKSVRTVTATVDVSNMIGTIARQMYVAGVRDAVRMHNDLLGHGKEK
jgi:hypothetical protein